MGGDGGRNGCSAAVVGDGGEVDKVEGMAGILDYRDD